MAVLLVNVLVRNRLKPIAVAADIKQTFLQVQVLDRMTQMCGQVSMN